MDQLSACYFCGAALDAPLDEYPVVPKALHPDPDEQATVVLCPGCREKLGTVVERVVAVAGDGDPVGGERDGPTDEGGTAKEGADEEGADGGDTDEWDELVGGDSSPAESDGADPSPDHTPAGEASSDGATTADGDASAGGDATAEDGPTADSDSTTGDDGATTDDATTGDDEATTDDATTDDGPSLTALEYNKVMRLLQNREFPVDRAEFRAVATNAYQISDAEFDAIVDAAVDRGLIAEENGQFVDGA